VLSVQERADSQEPQAATLSLLRLPQGLLDQERNPDGRFQAGLSGVDYRNLPAFDQLEVGFFNEVEPRSGSNAKDGLVSRAAHPRNLAERQFHVSGPVEVDESNFGGKRKNMRNAKRKELKDLGAARLKGRQS